MQQATLTLFAEWFKRNFYRVEATREANRQVVYVFGQTQALEHHNAEFNELLEKLPQPAIGNLLATATDIDHYLSSLSELLPAELTADYETPRKTVKDEHATIHRVEADGSESGGAISIITCNHHSLLVSEVSVKALRPAR